MAARSERFPTTLATRQLDDHQVRWQGHLFDYKDKGGTRHSSAQLAVNEHSVVKTLVFEDDAKKPLIVLMHGDRTVSTKELARCLGQKRIEACAPEVAQRHSGYQVGGTSPFGLRKPIPIYVEASVLELNPMYINGGQRGFLVAIDGAELVRVLAPTPVNVALVS